MANPKYDGVIEAVHYTPDGKVDWVRAYLRRGPTWGDRVIIPRQALISDIKAGRKMALGQRVEFMAGTFDISAPVKVVGTDGHEVLVTRDGASDRDILEGLPVL
jgi:hypothetical protein